MNKIKAKQLFRDALAYYEKNFKTELEWAKGVSQETFNKLMANDFLEQYCHVVYVSGFRVSIIEAIFPRLEKAFKNFDLEALAGMRSLSEVLSVINNKRKAECFLKGSKTIAKEGFPKFKKRLKEQGMSVLVELPYIGPITKYHLAKNIGLKDKPKPDRWLTRAADYCSTTVDELVTFLGKEYGMSRHAVDVVLWRHGADNNLGIKKG